jgi:zinc protease
MINGFDKSSKRFGGSVVVCLFIAVSLSLLPVAAAPASGSTNFLKIDMNVAEYHLENGMQVLILEDHASPVVSVQVWVKVGSRNEKPGITGISHLIEHMVFKGTEKVGPEEYSRIVQKYGGTENAFTSMDMTVYHSVLPSSQLELILKLESDRFANALFDPEEYKSERAVVMEERRLRENSPFSNLVEELRAVAFKVHPYRWPIIGWMSDLDGLERDKAVEYWKTYYVPGNATLIIAGDVDKEKALSLAEKYFGAIPKGPPPPSAIPQEPEQRGEKRVIVRKDVKIPLMAIAYHVPQFEHEDNIILDLISSILGEGESSRLYRKMVYEQQIVTSVGGDVDSTINPGLFTFYAVMQKGHRPSEAEKAILEEIERLKNEQVQDKELKKAVNGNLSYFVSRQQSVRGQGMLLGRFNLLSDYRMVAQYMERLRAVTKEDIMRVARKYFTATNRTVAYLLPKEGS